MEHVDYLIIGGGAAGMAAALQASAQGRQVLLADRADRLGGILNQCIHHGFGLGYFGQDMTGPEYAQAFLRKLEETSVDVRLGTTVLELRENKTALLVSPRGAEEVEFEKCILCTGARERTIGSLQIGGTRPAGIFTAGTAQKLINLGHYEIGSRVVILGSGDIGQIVARRLRLLGKDVVTMVEQGDQLGGLARNRRECIEAFQIPVMLNTTVEEVCGTGRISGVILRHLDSGERETIECDTLITAIGLIPERELLETVGTPEWLLCCGNCESIHDFVDTVSNQTAKAVAAFE